MANNGLIGRVINKGNVIMTNLSDTELFNQLHIDVARNATDDFNLFHDSKKW